MKKFWENFNDNVNRHPDYCALETETDKFSYLQLKQSVDEIRLMLEKHKVKSLALHLMNCPAWIAIDLAASLQGIKLVPVPHFFSTSQIQHLVHSSRVDTLITPINNEDNNSIRYHVLGCALALKKLPIEKANQDVIQNQDNHILKVSYTSGTTGEPKGALITANTIDTVISSVVSKLNASSRDRHLCALPLSLLLENITGVYSILSGGGTCIVPSFSTLGLVGSSEIQANKLLNSLTYFRPTTMITVPHIAKELIRVIETNNEKIDSLRFVAVGGAPVAQCLIDKAEQLGLPLFQGYGLTESTSVVAFNTPDNQRANSVGKPLPHIKLRFDSEGQIIVSGSTSYGYINENYRETDEVYTGDTGYLDNDGYLYITGRKKTVFSTAFGRNISPEWVEQILLAQPGISQAVIYGENKPFNVAIITQRSSKTQPDSITKAVKMANQQLPDYAKITSWIKSETPFTIENGQLSTSQQIRRLKILQDYEIQIKQIYDERLRL